MKIDIDSVAGCQVEICETEANGNYYFLIRSDFSTLLDIRNECYYNSPELSLMTFSESGSMATMVWTPPVLLLVGTIMTTSLVASLVASSDVLSLPEGKELHEKKKKHYNRYNIESEVKRNSKITVTTNLSVTRFLI